MAAGPCLSRSRVVGVALLFRDGQSGVFTFCGRVSSTNVRPATRHGGPRRPRRCRASFSRRIERHLIAHSVETRKKNPGKRGKTRLQALGGDELAAGVLFRRSLDGAVAPHAADPDLDMIRNPNVSTTGDADVSNIYLSAHTSA